MLVVVVMTCIVLLFSLGDFLLDESSDYLVYEVIGDDGYLEKIVATSSEEKESPMDVLKKFTESAHDKVDIESMAKELLSQELRGA